MRSFIFSLITGFFLVSNIAYGDIQFPQLLDEKTIVLYVKNCPDFETGNPASCINAINLQDAVGQIDFWLLRLTYNCLPGFYVPEDPKDDFRVKVLYINNNTFDNSVFFAWYSSEGNYNSFKIDQSYSDVSKVKECLKDAVKFSKSSGRLVDSSNRFIVNAVISDLASHKEFVKRQEKEKQLADEKAKEPKPQNYYPSAEPEKQK